MDTPTYVLKEILSRGTLKDVTDAAWYLVGALASEEQQKVLLDFGKQMPNNEQFAVERVRLLHPYASLGYPLLIRTNVVSLSNGSLAKKYILQRYTLEDELSRQFILD